VFTRFLGRTDSLTDRYTRIQNASGTILPVVKAYKLQTGRCKQDSADDWKLTDTQ